VIIINTTGGRDNTTCCVDGECDCSSLSTALNNIANNTVINIISRVVSLQNKTTMGSGNLTNITITGNGTTIKCNNNGSVYCKSCFNVVIEGITWDRCGDPYEPFTAGTGLNIYNYANISLVHCTFQNSQFSAITLLNPFGYLIIKNCNFLSNVAALSIFNGGTDFIIIVLIQETNFEDNGNFTEQSEYLGGNALYIDDNSVSTWNITISKSNFSYNFEPTFISLYNSIAPSIILTEVLVYKNKAQANQNFYIRLLGDGLISLVVLSSDFSDNSGNSSLLVDAGNIDLVIRNSTITENRISYYSVVNVISHCGSLTLRNLQIANNTILRSNQSSADRISGIFSFQFSYDTCNTTIDMVNVNIESNVCEHNKAGTLYIKNYGTNITFDQCVFTNNTSILGSAMYIDMQPNQRDGYYITISNSEFDHNSADQSNIYIDRQQLSSSSTIHFSLNGSNFTNNVGVCLFLSQIDLVMSSDILFKNNSADKGPALYLDHGSIAKISEEANIMFVNNSALLQGGAVFIELGLDCMQFSPVFLFPSSVAAEVSFVNNIARYGNNAVYFSILKYCDVIVNSSDVRSIMNVPYQFNYSQIINGTLTHIPIDFNYVLYTWLNVTQFPVVTSPHRLVLWSDKIPVLSPILIHRETMVSKIQCVITH